MLMIMLVFIHFSQDTMRIYHISLLNMIIARGIYPMERTGPPQITWMDPFSIDMPMTMRLMMLHARTWRTVVTKLLRVSIRIFTTSAHRGCPMPHRLTMLHWITYTGRRWLFAIIHRAFGHAFVEISLRTLVSTRSRYGEYPWCIFISHAHWADNMYHRHVISH